MTDVLKSVLFLNIIVLDARYAVQQKVRAKIDKTSMPQPFKDAAKKVGAKVASKLATPSVVAQKMSQEMPRHMPLKMAEKGMTVHAEAVFQEGPYLVVQLQVQRVDTAMMVEIKALERKEQRWSAIVEFLTWLMGLLGAKNQKSLEEEFLPRVVQKKIESIMTDMLKVRMEEDVQMQAETKVLGEDKQARYFFEKLKEVRETSKKGT